VEGHLVVGIPAVCISEEFFESLENQALTNESINFLFPASVKVLQSALSSPPQTERTVYVEVL
jgi:hypothetical protein